MISRLRHYIDGFLWGFAVASVIYLILAGIFIPDKALEKSCPEGYIRVQERGEPVCVQESGVRGWSHE